MNRKENQRIEVFRKLYIGEDAEKRLLIYQKQLRRKQLLILITTLLITILFYLNADEGEALKGGYLLARPAIETGDNEIFLKIKGVSDDVKGYFRISPKAYQEDELSQVFNEEFERIKEDILGDNTDFYNIESALDFSLKPLDKRIKVLWEPDDTTLISLNGEIIKAEIPMEGIHSAITVILKYEQYERRYPIFVRILSNSIEKSFDDELHFYVQSQIDIQKEQDVIALPETYQGDSLYYETKQDNRLFYILGVGLILIIGSTFSGQEQLRKQLKKRDWQMMRDYSDIVSRLVLLTGCGLSVKNAWKKICQDYIRNIKVEGQAKRYAYEEMVFALYRMENGISEGKAYGGFAVNCGLHAYMKLGRLLEQNIKMGNKQLRLLLEAEVYEAFQQRKNMARIMSEEAGTKLLFPMFLLLLMLLLILMVPALMMFTV